MKRRHRRSRVRERTSVAVRPRPAWRQQGLAVLGTHVFRCAVGRGAIAARKREGDGATPLGAWKPVEVRYRADRVPRPRTRLPARAIRRDDGWCDAPRDRNYNRAVRLPYPASAERMWRDDGLYDIVVVLDHNARPRARGRGSAVFVHVARDGFAPTEGCAAFAARDLLRLLTHWRPGQAIAFGA